MPYDTLAVIAVLAVLVVAGAILAFLLMARRSAALRDEADNLERRPPGRQRDTSRR